MSGDPTSCSRGWPYLYIAYSGCDFEQGAEGSVLHCHEIKDKGIDGTRPIVGPSLVAKQTRSKSSRTWKISTSLFAGNSAEIVQ